VILLTKKEKKMAIFTHRKVWQRGECITMERQYVRILDICNKNVSDISSSDSHYEISDAYCNDSGTCTNNKTGATPVTGLR
jgi:hypothetical protein